MDLEPDSQPCGPTVLDDPGPFHPSDDDVEGATEDVMVVGEQLPPTLPMESAKKKQKVDAAPPTQCKDQIKWVGCVPFVLDHRTQKIHCGNAIMYKTRSEGLTVIHCLTSCCILGGHADGQGCSCFCHLLANSYKHEWPDSLT